MLVSIDWLALALALGAFVALFRFKTGIPEAGALSPIDDRSFVWPYPLVAKARTLPQLGELELSVLEYLWTEQDADVHEAHAAVGRRRGISPNTVGSALERLYKKGLLVREKVSHAYRYRAALARETYRARKVVEAAGGLSALGKSGLLAAFVDLVADSDEAALAELERLVRARRRESGL